MLDAVNLVAVISAAVAAFLFGAVWYSAFGKPWMRAARLTPADTRPRPSLFVTAFACQIVMAFVLAGVMFHAWPVTVANGLITAGLVWLGFVLPTQTVNHRFQSAPWALTAIDGGHWLGVLAIQGTVIGAFG